MCPPCCAALRPFLRMQKEVEPLLYNDVAAFVEENPLDEEAAEGLSDRAAAQQEGLLRKGMLMLRVTVKVGVRMIHE